MPRIPFPPGLQGSDNLPRTRQSLSNCFNNGEGIIIGRPGIEEITTTAGVVARGQFVWQESLYRIESLNLVKVTDTTTGATTTIGTIAGSANVEIAIGFNTAVLVVKGGALYTLDTVDTLVDISGNSNIVASVAVAHIDGRFVYIPEDGDPAFFSDVGAAGTVQATSFFDAEELPDKNSTVFNLRNTLYIGGTDSFELYRDTGADPVPFTRLTGARLDYGFIGGLVAYADTFCFIGREKDQDYGIYAIGQGRADKLSNEVIDVILSEQIASVRAATIGGRFKWRGYDIMTFSMGTDSFGFFGGQWFTLDSQDVIAVPWGGGFVRQFEGEYFTAFEDKFGKLTDINTEYGNKIERIIDMGFESEDGRDFACQSITFGISQGFNTDDVSVGLAMSRNNVEYGEFLFRDLGDFADYTAHLIWNEPGGLGVYDGFMGFRIYTTQDVVFDANSLIAEFRN